MLEHLIASWYLNIWKKSFRSKENVLLVLKVLSFRLIKQASKNAVNTTFNECTSIRTMLFMLFINLSVLTINSFNVSKSFTLLLTPYTYVLTCFHVSHACKFYVPFLICSVIFSLLVIVYRHIIIWLNIHYSLWTPTPFCGIG